ncbi:AAA family ATPase [Microbacter margulisiae]|uniref:Energy-coupling factor transporter ATP-binding protein EcfA2 n=1 Tax=Microbacter margulisiae TaxID=1350067 RepID=A0A7W5DNA1_9PORP|nr:AAA family ATPase [Microbacter margulisiae]MBB3186072.1 energy-coupling factor transporter ATP-binding protein EcfA2 [Microbacter margulisiae]
METFTFAENEKANLALGYIRNTNRNLFLTGKAGTGKTTLLKQIKELIPKRMVVVAPTGVAALNAGGVTIHSFFSLPLSPFIPVEHSATNEKSLSKIKIEIIRNLDLLIIDEISMVRADLLDAIDAALRRFRKNATPFGGVQLLMIGDLQQLPPVVTDTDRILLNDYYHTYYFFGSYALQKTNFITIELEHIYRQRDEQFLHLLNSVRENRLEKAVYNLLKSRYVSNFHSEDHIILTTHNNQAQRVNADYLERLPAKSHRFEAVVTGEFSISMFPTDSSLELKKGARVMFLRNDSSEAKAFYNGKIGVITALNDDSVSVLCDGESDSLTITPMEWQNMQYIFNEETKEIEETPIGSFTQIPLKLAWAITIHKSQGLTFDRVAIDAKAAFAHGQVYVALSRCRSLDGLVLSSLFAEDAMPIDWEITTFTAKCEQERPTAKMLEMASKEYIVQLLTELFDFKIIAQNINKLYSLLEKYKTVITGLNVEELVVMKTNFDRDVMDVNMRFSDRLTLLLQSNEPLAANSPLQARIQKAISYYVDKIESIVLSVLQKIHIETDNQTVQKTWDEQILQLFEEAWEKKYCLESCIEGFDIQDYLKSRSNAAYAFEKEQRKEHLKNQKYSIAVPHQELYLQLRAWRNAKAIDLGIEPHAVLRQVSMEEITTMLPSSKKELSTIKGIGAKRIRQFGDELLEIITEYMIVNGLTKH